MKQMIKQNFTVNLEIQAALGVPSAQYCLAGLRAGRLALDQDEDTGLILVVPADPSGLPPVTILGLPFRPMTDDDYAGLGGAEPGSYIARTATSTLVWDPVSDEVSEVLEDGAEITWTRREVLGAQGMVQLKPN